MQNYSCQFTVAHSSALLKISKAACNFSCKVNVMRLFSLDEKQLWILSSQLMVWKNSAYVQL